MERHLSHGDRRTLTMSPRLHEGACFSFFGVLRFWCSPPPLFIVTGLARAGQFPRPVSARPYGATRDSSSLLLWGPGKRRIAKNGRRACAQSRPARLPPQQRRTGSSLSDWPTRGCLISCSTFSRWRRTRPRSSRRSRRSTQICLGHTTASIGSATRSRGSAPTASTSTPTPTPDIARGGVGCDPHHLEGLSARSVAMARRCWSARSRFCRAPAQASKCASSACSGSRSGAARISRCGLSLAPHSGHDLTVATAGCAISTTACRAPPTFHAWAPTPKGRATRRITATIRAASPGGMW